MLNIGLNFGPDSAFGERHSEPDSDVASMYCVKDVLKVHISVHETYATGYNYFAKPTAVKPRTELGQAPLFTHGHPTPEKITAAPAALAYLEKREF